VGKSRRMTSRHWRLTARQHALSYSLSSYSRVGKLWEEPALEARAFSLTRICLRSCSVSSYLVAHSHLPQKLLGQLVLSIEMTGCWRFSASLGEGT